MTKPTYLYICVSSDRYELPVAVADSPAELSRMVGIKWQSISQAISKSKHGKKTPYKKVRVDNV